MHRVDESIAKTEAMLYVEFYGYSLSIYVRTFHWIEKFTLTPLSGNISLISWMLNVSEFWDPKECVINYVCHLKWTRGLNTKYIFSLRHISNNFKSLNLSNEWRIQKNPCLITRWFLRQGRIFLFQWLRFNSESVFRHSLIYSPLHLSGKFIECLFDIWTSFSWNFKKRTPRLKATWLKRMNEWSY